MAHEETVLDGQSRKANRGECAIDRLNVIKIFWEDEKWVFVRVINTCVTPERRMPYDNLLGTVQVQMVE